MKESTTDYVVWGAGGVLCLCLLIGGLAVCVEPQPVQLPAISIPIHPLPLPTPAPTPKPRPHPPKPWDFSKLPVGSLGRSCHAIYTAGDDSSFMNGRTHAGENIAADFAVEDWFQNIGSKRDGAGMCVMTSIEMTARYLGLEDFRGLRDWCAQEPGGGYPGKVDDQLKRYCEVKGITCPPYLQYEGDDPEPLLRRLDEEGMPFAHTYGWSPRYAQKIDHMVFSAKFSGNYAVVVDNNPIGGLDPKTSVIYEWMSSEEHIRRMKYGGAKAWVFAWLVPPPPPPPTPNSLEVF